MSKLQNAWIETYSSIRFYPLSPKIEDINIRDIIHSLSNQCRYTGHCSTFYSIAQHCVLGAKLFLRDKKKNLAKAFLLHDACEAYLCDLSAPVKQLMPEYRKAEEVLDKLIALRFDLEYPWAKEVTEMDMRMRYFEAHSLGFHHVASWQLPVIPTFELVIDPWNPNYAKRCFLEFYIELFGLKYGKI